MHINTLNLTQFKNYAQRQFLFEAPLVAIGGPNGSGKTNLLDALYFLSFTRSYFTRTDAASVRTGTQGFALEASIHQAYNDVQVKLILRENGKKELWVDGDLQKKLSSHIGRFPAVMIAPDDVAIIAEGSEERRRLIDMILCQVQPAYMEQLMAYNKVLQQRNALLRQAAAHGYNELVLDTLDEQLVATGSYIFKERTLFCQRYLPAVLAQYQQIAGAATDDLQMSYQSSLQHDHFAELLWQNRQRDLYLQRSSVGIHKDELLFLLDGQPLKTRASQGQRKSLLFAIRLAEYDLLQAEKGFAPLLLLDDVFEKLDAQRMENLLMRVARANDAQIFVTDTHPERLKMLLANTGKSFQLIQTG